MSDHQVLLNSIKIISFSHLYFLSFHFMVTFSVKSSASVTYCVNPPRYSTYCSFGQPVDLSLACFSIIFLHALRGQNTSSWNTIKLYALENRRWNEYIAGRAIIMSICVESSLSLSLALIRGVIGEKTGWFMCFWETLWYGNPTFCSPWLTWLQLQSH